MDISLVLIGVGFICLVYLIKHSINELTEKVEKQQTQLNCAFEEIQRLQKFKVAFNSAIGTLQKYVNQTHAIEGQLDKQEHTINCIQLAIDTHDTLFMTCNKEITTANKSVNDRLTYAEDLLQSSNAEIHSLLYEIDRIYAKLNKLDEYSDINSLTTKLLFRVNKLDKKWYSIVDIKLTKCYLPEYVDEEIQCNGENGNSFILFVNCKHYQCCKLFVNKESSFNRAISLPMNTVFSEYIVRDNNQWTIVPI